MNSSTASSAGASAPKPRTDPDSPWRSRASAACYVGLSVSRLAHLAVIGKGPKFRRTPNGSVRYHIADLDRWMGDALASTTERAKRDRELAAA